MTPAVLVAAVGVAGLIAGCTQSHIANEWRDPDFDGGRIASLLVVSQEPADIDRRLWEDAIGRGLADHGIEAQTSYSTGDGSVPARAQLASVLASEKLDGAIFLRPMRDERDVHYIPGYTTYEPRSWYDPWRPYRRPVTVWHAHHEPGYHVVDVIERTQVTLWVRGEDGGAPRMVWAATVESENPSSSDQMRHDIEAGVFPALQRAGVLPKKGERGV